MYSYEDRIRAVKLYIKMGKRAGVTIRQLGYPTKNSLKSWYAAYPRSLRNIEEMLAECGWPSDRKWCTGSTVAPSIDAHAWRRFAALLPALQSTLTTQPIDGHSAAAR